MINEVYYTIQNRKTGAQPGPADANVRVSIFDNFTRFVDFDSAKTYMDFYHLSTTKFAICRCVITEVKV